jgi:superfamily II DNA helicase RecQ
MNNEIRIIVASRAFGVGIDKEDIEGMIKYKLSLIKYIK